MAPDDGTTAALPRDNIATDDSSRALSRAARLAGLRGDGESLTSELPRRRIQLWAVLAALLVVSATVTGLLALEPTVGDRLPISATVPTIGLTVLSVIFAFYVLEKERALGKVSDLLYRERLTRARLEAQTRQLHHLLKMRASLAASLDRDSVRRLVVENVAELVHAETAGLLAGGAEGVRTLAVWPDSSTMSEPATALARRALGTTEPQTHTLRTGADRLHTIAVPLVRHGTSVAVLVVGGEFDEFDVAALHGFSDYAVTALENARLYRQDTDLVARLEELEHAHAEFQGLAQRAEPVV